jgi:uncharacterized protein involved in exopolysaccharide biosynthesis
MSMAATIERENAGVAWLRRRRWLSFSPFDPNTPHLRWAVVCILVLWLAVLTGLHFIPKQYVSKSTLIVPGASTSVNVSLDKIGQASSSPVSAYNTGALSPKVIYKEMITSEDVRSEAARALGIPMSRMGSPRIKLVDETALINIEMRGRDGEMAHRQNQALIEALQRRLDRLRADELERRQSTVKENLSVYEVTVSQARDKILNLQHTSGLQSSTQFNEISTALVRRTQRLGELTAELERMSREQDVLAQRLGMTAKTAALGLRITADPSNGKVLSDFADARAKYDIERRRLGPSNPVLIQLQQAFDVASGELRRVAQASGLLDPAHVDMVLMLANNTHQVDMFKRLVGNESVLEGRRAEVATTAREVADLEREHMRLGRVAAELEDLKKTQLVAEAVLTTAIARIATSRSDIFGSYPLVQVLSSPSRSDTPGGAQGLYTVAGGVLGTLLLALAWFLAWLRTGSVQRTLRNA